MADSFFFNKSCSTADNSLKRPAPSLSMWCRKWDYRKGDFVIYENVLYICEVANTSIEPTDTTYWSPVDLSGMSLKGETGPRGPQGPAGPQGPKGDRGEKGEKGDRGEKGSQGPRGYAGDPGPRGEKGEPGERGATGPQGLKGEKGDAGEQGPRGQQGPKGDRGIQGLQGEPGERGQVGPRGEKGDTGEKGEKGDAAVISEAKADYIEDGRGPSIELYNHGDEHKRQFHFIFKNLQGPKGEKGDQGEQGLIGPQGEQGEKGDKGEKGESGNGNFFVGKGIYTEAGYENDVYLDLETGIFYKWINTQWIELGMVYVDGIQQDVNLNWDDVGF